MRIVLFEDDQVSQLFPITLTRPAYTITCGSESLVEWACRWGSCVRGQVRPYLGDWQQAERPSFCDQVNGREHVLLVNARVAPHPANCRQLTSLLNAGETGKIISDDQLVAAVLPADVNLKAQSFETRSQLSEFLQRPEIKALPNLSSKIELLQYPHQFVQCHLDSMKDHLDRRIRSGQLHEIRDGVFTSGSTLSDHVVTDTTGGPIVIESQVTIRPFACLSGPVYLAANSRIHEHTVLRNAVYIGPHAKVGGEVSASVIEAYSNKSHHGYLGHSYVGQWVNLGAGTSNSDLKNSYGNVRIELGSRTVDTGMQFMGCVIGDFTKTAINTSIFTGKLIGACSMLYGFVTTNVPSFVNYARSFGQTTEMNPSVVALTQKRAFQRRGIEQQDWHRQLLQDAYEIVASERQLVDRPLSL